MVEAAKIVNPRIKKRHTGEKRCCRDESLYITFYNICQTSGTLAVIPPIYIPTVA